MWTLLKIKQMLTESFQMESVTDGHKTRDKGLVLGEGLVSVNGFGPNPVAAQAPKSYMYIDPLIPRIKLHQCTTLL